MIRAGFAIANPVTHSYAVVLEGDAETANRGWLLGVHTAPEGPPGLAEHLHLAWTESFEIVAGRAHYQLEGVRHGAAAGDTVVFPPGRRHIHPWNAGAAALVYRQRTAFDRPDPRATQDVLGAVATLAGLARAGKVNARGAPRNPLRLAVLLKALTAHGSYDANLPLLAQRVLAATLGNLAAALGYRATDPHYAGEPPPPR